MTDEIEKFLDDITRKSSISIAMSNPAWLSRFAAETAIKADRLGKENLHLCSRIAELEAALKPLMAINTLYVSPQIASVICSVRKVLEKKDVYV